MTTHDPVQNPRHYNAHPSGVETIEITEHLSFNLGNATKYLWRWRDKNGAQDLRKAAWYLRREAALWERRGADAICGFADDNDEDEAMDAAFRAAVDRVVEKEMPVSPLRRILALLWDGFETDELRALADDIETLARDVETTP